MTVQQQAADMIYGLSDDGAKFIIEMITRMTKPIEVKMDSVAENKTEVKNDKPRRKIGFISDAFVSIAPDFDETPDCMKEYV